MSSKLWVRTLDGHWGPRTIIKPEASAGQPAVLAQHRCSPQMRNILLSRGADKAVLDRLPTVRSALE